jgi:hypothetical protein
MTIGWIIIKYYRIGILNADLLPIVTTLKRILEFGKRVAKKIISVDEKKSPC